VCEKIEERNKTTERRVDQNKKMEKPGNDCGFWISALECGKDPSINREGAASVQVSGGGERSSKKTK